MVVTTQPPEHTRLVDRFTFATDLFTAVRQAAALAGDLDVAAMGGGELVRRSLDAGAVRILRLHLSPVLLGGGTPLLTGGMSRRLTQLDVQSSPNAVHLTYRVA